MRFTHKILLIPLIAFFMLVNQQICSAHNYVGRTYVVEMRNSGFVPNKIELQQGDAILFKNIDSMAHWPASNLHPSHGIYPEFDPKVSIRPGKSWKFVFEKEGKWKFHDHLLPPSFGEVIVKKNPLYIPDEPKESPLVKLIKPIMLNIRISVAKFFYNIFPAELDKQLAKETIFEDSNNDEKLTYYFEVAGSKKVIAKLYKESANINHLECHMRLHNIGRVFYRVFREESYALNDYICAAGIAHGVMEEYIYQRGMDNLEKDINTLCKNYHNEFDELNCYHGIGHGIMASMNWDLPKSIAICRYIKKRVNQDMCFTGLFMENNFRNATNWIKPDDPVYPCNQSWVSNSEQTLRTCFQNQIRSIRLANDNSFEKTIVFCGTLPKNIQIGCYQGIGRDASVTYLRNPVYVASICRGVPDEYYRPCLERSLFMEMSFNGPEISNQARLYCDVVKEKDKGYCYNLVGRAVPNNYTKPKNTADLEVIRKRLQAVCNPEYLNDCMEGARTKVPTL